MERRGPPSRESASISRALLTVVKRLAHSAAQILNAGWQMFLERGVEAVAVEAIAARAGVSKATFYKHFAGKATLFEAAVRRKMQGIEVTQQSPCQSESDMNLEATLRQFGIGLMSFLFSPAAVDFYRVESIRRSIQKRVDAGLRVFLAVNGKADDQSHSVDESN